MYQVNSNSLLYYRACRSSSSCSCCSSSSSSCSCSCSSSCCSSSCSSSSSSCSYSSSSSSSSCCCCFTGQGVVVMEDIAKLNYLLRVPSQQPAVLLSSLEQLSQKLPSREILKSTKIGCAWYLTSRIAYVIFNSPDCLYILATYYKRPEACMQLMWLYVVVVVVVLELSKWMINWHD